MRIYVNDIEKGYFKIGKDTEVVSSMLMCKNVTLPSPQRTFMQKIFKKDIKKCIPFLYIEVERMYPFGNLRLTMHPTIFNDLQEVLKFKQTGMEYKKL